MVVTLYGQVGKGKARRYPYDLNSRPQTALG